ncbi:MAG: DUF1343 domain-containing protein [Bacillota bacterium]
MQAILGIDRVKRDHLPGRIGLVSHAPAVDQHLHTTLEHLEGLGVQVSALFAPEHGLSGAVSAGQAFFSDLESRSIPIYSLYGETYRPTEEMLAGLDRLVIDLQDIGSRYYTYVSTMYHCLEAAAASGLPAIVLDRPNPLGGIAVEGGGIEPGLRSFVGIQPIPSRHGLTMGELAHLFRDWAGLDLDLTVITMDGWQRSYFWPDTGLPWVPPTPNSNSFEMALCYPGTCLFEGTNLSEGRGTALPFRWIGAPWLDPEAVLDQVSRVDLPGTALRPIEFTPSGNKHGFHDCQGLEVHPVDPRVFRPLRLGLTLLAAICRQHPLDFAWRDTGGEFFFDRLSGGRWVRETIDDWAGSPEPLEHLVEQVEARWETERAGFMACREKYFLYR